MSLTLPVCAHCATPLQPERVISDPWREQVAGARRFEVRPRAGQPLDYVLSCGNCLAVHHLRLGGEHPEHVQTLATSDRMLGLARAIEEQSDPWPLVEPMLQVPAQAELLGTPEIFARWARSLGGYVRLLQKARVDLRPEPPDLPVPLGPHSVFSPEQLSQGPVLPLAFKLFPLGLRNGLLIARPDRIRSKDGRQLPLVAVPLAWVRRQDHVPLPESHPIPPLPSGEKRAQPVVVEPVFEEEPPPPPSDPFALPEPAGLEALVSADPAERALPKPLETSRDRLIDGPLDPEVLAGWDEDLLEEDSSWASRPSQSTELAESFAALLSERLGPPVERFTDPDTRLALTVHVYATPERPGCVTLITDGMRRYKMPAVGPDAPRHLELCWTLEQGHIQGIGSWPVQLLIRLARMPFSTRSATWPGDVLGPLRPGFGNSGLRDALLWPSAVLPAPLSSPLTPQGRTQVLAVWPIEGAQARQAEQEDPAHVIAALLQAGGSEVFALSPE